MENLIAEINELKREKNAELSELKFTDNTLGFGKKLTWSKQMPSETIMK